MPSRLATDIFQRSPRGVLRLLQVRPVHVRNWGGFCPDLPSPLAGPGDAINEQGLIPLGGALHHDRGWTRVDSANLPLGEAGGSATDEPVIGLIHYQETTGTRRSLAVTADTTLGHVYELAGGTWTNRAYDTTPGPSAGITGSDANLVDWAYFPPDNQVIFCNGNDSAPVYQWPVTGGAANEYSDFNQTAFGRTVHPGFTLFRARSVTAVADRLLFLNTHEGGTDFRNRVRWTTIGGGASLTGVGSGFINLNELTEGVRVLPLGDRIACYCNDGIALLERTRIPTDAFRLKYLTHELGLLGTQSVVELDRGIHFGIFNNGWYLLHSNGVWQEVGLREAGNQVFHKWRDTFYQRLDHDNKERVVCTWDPNYRLVRIAFPQGSSDTGAPDSVWMYHVDTDTVWIDSYGANTPNIWGRLDIESNIETWDSQTTTWQQEEGSGRTWANVANVVEPTYPSIGTMGGLVFRMDPELTTRDGSGVSWFYTSHQIDGGRIDERKHHHSIYYTYMREAGATPFTLTATTENGSRSTSVAQSSGTIGSVQTNGANLIRSGSRTGWSISGSGVINLQAIQMNLQIEGAQDPQDD